MRNTRLERGTSLLETLIATAICMVVMFPLAAMMTSSMKQNKNQGETVAQATTLCAQKLDELMQKTYTTSTADAALTAGGGITVGTEVTSYVDYLDKTGGTSVASTSAARFFTRQWLIEDVGSPVTKKRVTVLVYGKAIGRSATGAASGAASIPQATLACYKVMQ